MSQHCPACGEKVCSSAGQGDLLIIGDAPGKLEMQQGRPFAIHPVMMTAGRILMKEMERCGVSLGDFRVITMWLHEPNDIEGCWQASYDHVLDEAKGKKAILLIGADVVETFTGYKVSDVSGLQVDSSVLSAPIIYASVNPSLAMHRSIGEVRHAIEKFTARLDQEGLA